MILNQILSIILKKECIEISLENLYVDLGAQRVMQTTDTSFLPIQRILIANA